MKDLYQEELLKQELKQEAEAKTKLIAAAPDLLEALQSMLNITWAANAAAHNLGAFKGLDVEYHRRKALDAIQKATE